MSNGPKPTDQQRALMTRFAESLPYLHDKQAAVLDSDAHQFAVEYASLSINGKRHARAMVAGLVRLEAGAT